MKRIALLAFAVLLLAAPASASPRGGGSFVETSSKTIASSKVGKVQILVLHNVVKWTGSIGGTAQEYLWVTIAPTGLARFAGVDVCSCTNTSGAKGTITMPIEGLDNGKTYTGTYTLGQGTGALASWHGSGTFKGSDKTHRGTYLPR